MVFCKLHRWSRLSKELLPPFLLPSHPQECSGFERKHTHTHTHARARVRTHGKSFQYLDNGLHFAGNPSHSGMNDSNKSRCPAWETTAPARVWRWDGDGAAAGLLLWCHDSFPRHLPCAICHWFAGTCAMALLGSPSGAPRPSEQCPAWPTWPLGLCLHGATGAASGDVTYS